MGNNIQEELINSCNRSLQENQESNNDLDSREVNNNEEMPDSGQMLMIPTIDNTNDLVSTTTESEAIITLANQSDLYSNPHQEEVKQDTEKTLQRYIYI